MRSTKFYDKYENIYSISRVLNSDGVTDIDKECDLYNGCTTRSSDSLEHFLTRRRIQELSYIGQRKRVTTENLYDLINNDIMWFSWINEMKR